MPVKVVRWGNGWIALYMEHEVGLLYSSNELGSQDPGSSLCIQVGSNT